MVVVAAEPDIALPPADVVERVAAFAPALDQGVSPKELDRNLIVGSESEGVWWLDEEMAVGGRRFPSA